MISATEKKENPGRGQAGSAGFSTHPGQATRSYFNNNTAIETMSMSRWEFPGVGGRPKRLAKTRMVLSKQKESDPNPCTLRRTQQGPEIIDRPTNTEHAMGGAYYPAGSLVKL
jgi:hypothetical protein